MLRDVTAIENDEDYNIMHGTHIILHIYRIDRDPFIFIAKTIFLVSGPETDYSADSSVSTQYAVHSRRCSDRAVYNMPTGRYLYDNIDEIEISLVAFN